MSSPRLGIIISTTRANRFGDKPAQWLLKNALDSAYNTNAD
jgi:hypothetical protein